MIFRHTSESPGDLFYFFMFPVNSAFGTNKSVVKIRIGKTLNEIISGLGTHLAIPLYTVLKLFKKLSQAL